MIPVNIDIIVREWVPGRPDPPSILYADDHDTNVHRCNPETWFSTLLGVDAHRRHRDRSSPDFVVVVDQCVDWVDLEPLVGMQFGPRVASAYVATSGLAAEAWYEPVSPYVWAAPYRTVMAIIEAAKGQLPQMFGVEVLVGELAKRVNVPCVHVADSVAYLTDDAEIEEARGNLYYREIADLDVVHGAIGWTSPSS